MALILNFVPRATQRPPDALPEGPEAAIIIFPGVRYERRDEAEQPAAAREPASAKSPGH